MQDTFTVGGEKLRYPGDPAGSPWNTINCRCTQLPVLDDMAAGPEEPVTELERLPEQLTHEQLMPWFYDLSDEDRGALAYYQGSGFININAGLRGMMDIDELTRDMIREMDAVVAQNKLSDATTLFRGFKPEQFGVTDMRDLLGKTIQDNGFISTSIQERIAQSFALSHDGVVAQIIAPKGLNAAYIPDEFEVVLKRGLRLVVETVTKRDVDGEILDYVLLRVVP